MCMAHKQTTPPAKQWSHVHLKFNGQLAPASNCRLMRAQSSSLDTNTDVDVDVDFVHAACSNKR